MTEEQFFSEFQGSLFEDEDGFVSNVPFESMYGYYPLPKKCTCGAAKLGYTELRAHYSWCDLQPEVKK